MMRRLLTTAPGSATPTLAPIYTPDQGTELQLITHIVPTPEAQNVHHDSGRPSQNATDLATAPSFGNL